MLAIQPRLHNPTGRDCRRARVSGCSSSRAATVLHPRGRDLRRPALRGQPLPLAARRAPGARHLLSTRSRRRSAAGCASAGSRRAGPVLERIAAEKRKRRHPQPDADPARARPLLATGAYAGQVERARDHYRRGRDALLEVDRAPPRLDRRLLRAARRRPRLARARPHRSRARARRRGGPARASPTSPAARCRSTRARTLAMRLSYSYVEPELIDEGVRRIASAIALRARLAAQRARSSASASVADLTRPSPAPRPSARRLVAERDQVLGRRTRRRRRAAVVDLLEVVDQGVAGTRPSGPPARAPHAASRSARIWSRTPRPSRRSSRS